MLDMSKAFDSIDRQKLMMYLSEVLNESEMYMLNLLVNDVVINVQIGNDGENIETNVGSCQGDCLSAIFFIFYLAKSIKPLPASIERQNYMVRIRLASKSDVNNVNIDPKYSDDINFIRSYYLKINQLKKRNS